MLFDNVVEYFHQLTIAHAATENEVRNALQFWSLPSETRTKDIDNHRTSGAVKRKAEDTLAAERKNKRCRENGSIFNGKTSMESRINGDNHKKVSWKHSIF